MAWQATERYGLETAPGDLALVQDFLNTVAAGIPLEPDLFADAASAQEWAEQATGDWSVLTGLPAPEVEVDVVGLVELRALRDELHGLLAEGTAGTRPPSTGIRTAAATLQLDADGRVHMEPRGTGWRKLVSMILAALLRAQIADTARRLKTCRNPRCRTAFYDRSRNNSGVWHDVKTCGNAANLRAYRARQRAKTS
ncbi:CGNR zinc finger domain-containing protein [Streptomyces sp. AHA2]|uniref:CGNR zinc finger domain-containing protein n=1 Tax=Streptomyces sp. AHA2 TaxID=3064526 RepID=UPI002FE2757A